MKRAVYLKLYDVIEMKYRFEWTSSSKESKNRNKGNLDKTPKVLEIFETKLQF